MGYDLSHEHALITVYHRYFMVYVTILACSILKLLLSDVGRQIVICLPTSLFVLSEMLFTHLYLSLIFQTGYHHTISLFPADKTVYVVTPSVPDHISRYFLLSQAVLHNMRDQYLQTCSRSQTYNILNLRTVHQPSHTHCPKKSVKTQISVPILLHSQQLLKQ